MVRIMILAAVMLIAADGQAAEVRVLGHGASSCGAWTRERELHGGHYIPEGAWVLGYLSGVNLNSPLNSGDLFVDLDVDAIFAWIDNYCRSKPLDRVLDASVALVIQLRSRGQRRR